ncbi:MAG: baseplate J/gp47 family protein [Polyangiaceae bacterium]|nr:baseplate J/gp47 family protein [Polyangiaceae bacterium]
MTTLAEALAAKTEAQILQALVAEAAARGCDVAGFSPYSISATLPALDARALSVEQALRVQITRAGFLDLAAGAGDEWVDYLVKAWFGIDRIPATKARRRFKLTAAPSAGTIAVAPRELVADAGGVLFENTTAFEVLAGTTTYREFECRSPGLAGNILPGAILGFQIGKPGLTVANEAGDAIFAGRPAETNDALVARGRAKFPAGSVGGSRDAYLVWVEEAFSTQGLTSTITKIGVDDGNPNGPGSTDIYLANAAGPATVDELAVVDAYLQPRRAKGSGPLRVLAAEELIQPVVGTLFVDGNPTAVADAVAAMAELQADLPLGGGPRRTLYVDSIRGALLGPDGVLGVYKLNLSDPSQDLGLATFQVVVLVPSFAVAQ